MAILTLRPNETESRDCSIRNGSGSNTPSNVDTILIGTLRVLGTDTYWRSLLRFDLASVAGNVISAASLTVSSGGGATPAGGSFYAYRITRVGWTEDATWNNYDGASPWTTAGGDYTTTNGALFTHPGGDGPLVFDVLDLIKDARAAGLTSLEVILVGPEVPGASNYVAGLSSADSVDANRPTLTLTVSGPGCVTVDLTEPWMLDVSLAGCSVRRIPSMGYDIVDQGDLPRSTASFTTSAGAALDPDVVSCTVLAPDGTETNYIYGTDEEIVRDSLGVYHIDINADQSGRWYYRWVSTGFGQAAEQQWFEAREVVSGT